REGPGRTRRSAGTPRPHDPCAGGSLALGGGEQAHDLGASVPAAGFTLRWNMVFFHHVAFERSPSLLRSARGRELVPAEASCNAGSLHGSTGEECSAPCVRSAPPRYSIIAASFVPAPPVVPCCIPFARSVLPANAGRAFVGSAPHTVSMDAWPRCLERLEAEFPAEDVHTWLKPLQASLRDDAFVLYAPNAFVMEEVRSRYLDRIRELLSHFAGSDQVSLEIGSLRKKPAPAPASVPPTRPAATAETFQ